jgi:hypothetical protein
MQIYVNTKTRNTTILVMDHKSVSGSVSKSGSIKKQSLQLGSVASCAKALNKNEVSQL